MLVNSVTVWDEPDGYYKITTIYNLTSQNPNTYKCSDFGLNGSPNGKLPLPNIGACIDMPGFIPRRCDSELSPNISPN